ncbi:MAG TPA: hypothetical protein PLK38_04895, partial [Methanoregulaceae archaeon]|nr:hypothetical protein [Methanoregulaceae archaeon]
MIDSAKASLPLSYTGGWGMGSSAIPSTHHGWRALFSLSEKTKRITMIKQEPRLLLGKDSF